MVHLFSVDGKDLGPRDDSELRDLIAHGKATVVRGQHGERSVHVKERSGYNCQSVTSAPGRSKRVGFGGIRYAGIDSQRSAAVDEILARRGLRKK